MMTIWSISLLILCIKVLFLPEVTLYRKGYTDVLYRDLERLNATCGDLDNCKKERAIDDIPTYNCLCGEFCALSDTCCVDSKHRRKYFRYRNMYKCVEIYGEWLNYTYMIDTCDSSWTGVKSVAELCTSNGEELDDMFLLAPVTNPDTRTTYKNYYCSVCNNNDEKQLVFWNLSLKSKSEEVDSASVPEMHYNSSYKEWTVGHASKNSTIEKVEVKFIAPAQLKGVVLECLGEVVSECASNWVDASVEEKCRAYMALVSFRFGTKVYRNPHCAICNFESLESRNCIQKKDSAAWPSASNTFFVRIFSLYDKESKCEDDMVYDTIAKKCRKVFKG